MRHSAFLLVIRKASATAMASKASPPSAKGTKPGPAAVGRFHRIAFPTVTVASFPAPDSANYSPSVVPSAKKMLPSPTVMVAVRSLPSGW